MLADHLELAGILRILEGGVRNAGALESGNLFLFGLDDCRAWYRYHHLFAGFLRKEGVPLVRCVTSDLEVPAEADLLKAVQLRVEECGKQGVFGGSPFEITTRCVVKAEKAEIVS